MGDKANSRDDISRQTAENEPESPLCVYCLQGGQGSPIALDFRMFACTRAAKRREEVGGRDCAHPMVFVCLDNLVALKADLEDIPGKMEGFTAD